MTQPGKLLTHLSHSEIIQKCSLSILFGPNSVLGSGVQSQGGCDISSCVGQGMPRQGRTLSPSVSMRVFLEENSTGIGRWRKEDHLPQCAPASFNPLMVPTEQNGGGGASSPPLLELDVTPLTLW